MPYSIGTSVVLPDKYVLSYTMKHETVTASAPSKEEVKQLFEWLAIKVGLLAAPP